MYYDGSGLIQLIMWINLVAAIAWFIGGAHCYRRLDKKIKEVAGIQQASNQNWVEAHQHWQRVTGDLRAELDVWNKVLLDPHVKNTEKFFPTVEQLQEIKKRRADFLYWLYMDRHYVRALKAALSHPEKLPKE